MNGWIFGKINKKDKSLDELTKRMTQLNKIRDEKGERTTDTNEIHGISFRKEIGKFLDFTRERKALGLINTFSKVRQNANKKPIAFLYTNDKHTEKEIQEMTQLIIFKQYLIQYLGEYLIRERADLYDPIFKTLKKEVKKKNTKRWKNLPCSWSMRNNIVINSHLTQSNLNIQCPANRNSQGHSLQILKRILKCAQKHKRTRIA